MINSTSPVIVCVTAQKNCEKLIKVGYSLSLSLNVPLEVLSILPSDQISRESGEALDYLFSLAKGFGGQYNVFFHNDPALIAAAYIAKKKASHVIIGTPGVRTNGFIGTIKTLLPETPFTAIDAQGNTAFSVTPSPARKLAGNPAPHFAV